MTIASQTSRINYVGDSVTTAFAVPFYFLLNADIFVYQSAPGGSQVLKTLGTDYTLVGAGLDAGGTVTFINPPLTGYTITILRDPPVTQATSYNNNDPFPAKSHEKALDKLTMLIQRIKDRLTRSVTLSETSSYVDLTLPDPEAGQYLRWRADLTGLENNTAVTTIPNNYALASQSEAEAGTSNIVINTPLRTAQAVQTFLPHVQLWKNGIPGDDGVDRTVALQAIVDGMLYGGTIYIRGRVNITALDLSHKFNLTFKSDRGGTSAGANYSNRGTLSVTTGAVGADVAAIKCWTTRNVVFDGVWLYAINAAFDGTLLSWGSPTAIPGEDTFLPRVWNCILSTSNANSECMSLHGSTNGSFRDTTFTGPGCHIKMQDNAYTEVGFVNCHTFDTLSFLPSGTQYPVQGSCGACVFINPLFEPGSDTRIRAFQTSANRPFTGLTIINASIIDATLGGVEACIFPWGTGLNIIGGVGGSPTGYLFSLGGGGIAHGDPEVRGLRGVTIQGHSANGVAQMIAISGTIANKTNVRGLKVFGNAVTNGQLIAGSLSELECAELGPNTIYGYPNGIGAAKSLYGWPTYATQAAAISAGLLQGQEYLLTATGARHILP